MDLINEVASVKSIPRKAKLKYFDLEKEFSDELDTLTRSFSFSDWVRIADENKIQKHLKVNQQFQVIDKVANEIRENKINIKPVPKSEVIVTSEDDDPMAQRGSQVVEVVSETLANVYLSQSLYAYSIRVLEKLMLLNPEKSAYFAARIAEIQQKSAELGKQRNK
ncbi:MAG: hypothetical protein N2110_08280 [Flavobacteriales bacterium]|nr:hypothetical protein [Flavobacteriales bacterium]MCX7769004.1 hypothetical protein [Flavobacteriales bacterium]MDW8410207.1 hypothetical protein [Flavobacteriales bacterium]